MKHQKFKILTLVALGSLMMSACAGSDTADGTSEKEVTFRLGHVYEENHPMERCGVETLKEELADNGIEIDSYPAAQLGTETELMEQLDMGAVDIALTGAFLENWYEEASVFNASYLFNDSNAFIDVMESDIVLELYDDIAEASGMRVHGAWLYGTRQVTSDVPINTPEDLAGIKIRTVESPVHLQNIELMGGVGTPMALTEVYLGLQQGVIDAQENPVPTIASLNFQEVQDYVNLTDHVVNSVFVVAKEDLLDDLSKEQQVAFAEAIASATEAANNCVIEEENEILDEWETNETININDAVDNALFAETARDHWSEHPIFGDLYTQIRELQPGE
jgi:tripartite ATP-independent transporter DctP family solute receptor